MFSYPPIGESSSDLWLERTVFAGGILVSFAFGLYLCITSACVYFMLCRAPRGKRNWPLLAYILVLSLSSTLAWIANWLWCQMVFIDDRAYPGGPPAFFIDHFNAWANTVSDATLVINGVLADGFIIWRCYVIWDANRFIVAASILGYVASTVTSVLTLWETALPGRDPWSSVRYPIAYFSISLALNLTLTGLIVGRLLWHRRRLCRALGPDGYKSGKTYVSVAAVLIESAALYSATSVALIASFALGSYIAAWALPLLGEVMCIAPMLILLRVAFGRGYSRETMARLGWQGSNPPTTTALHTTLRFEVPRAGEVHHDGTRLQRGSRRTVTSSPMHSTQTRDVFDEDPGPAPPRQSLVISDPYPYCGV